MLDTRERKESKVRYERTNEYEPSYRNDYYAENSYTNVETYPEQRRATEEDRYVQRYENVDYGYNECDCMSNENTFRPIELSDIDMNEKSATKKRSKQKFNWSVKSKILVGVYFSLVALIVVMLFVNALPSASAQGGATEPAPQEFINEKGFDQTTKQTQQQSGIEQNAGYTYDTQTNWFDKMCDNISNMFN